MYGTWQMQRGSNCKHMELLTNWRVAYYASLLRVLLRPCAELSTGEFTEDDLVAAGVENRLFFFTDEQISAVMVVDIVTYFQKKVAWILALSGKASKLYVDKDVFDSWARQLGCTEVRCSCKSKQAKAFAKHGFVHLYGIYGYELGGVQ